MTYTTHVQYTDAGDITMVRTEETMLFNNRVTAGEKVIAVDDYIDPRLFKVNTETLQLVSKSDEELQAEGHEPPVFIDFTQFMGS